MNAQEHLTDLARWLRKLAKADHMERGGVVPEYFDRAAYQIDALLADKARLDWLDAQGYNVKNVNQDEIWREWDISTLDLDATLRTAIDAKRAKDAP